MVLIRLRPAGFLLTTFFAVGWPVVAAAQVAIRSPDSPEPEQHRPILLRNEKGGIINPVKGENVGEPYSPAQTCGASKCHDYKTIVSGYHFQQGAEVISDTFDAKHPWALSNGMFGQYRPAAQRQLAKKKNRRAAEIDLTVWEWVTGNAASAEPSCASCHPGGGPLELDRDGRRYDQTLAANGALAQSLDGDYRGSRWDKSGVLEADCLMCHLPAYDITARTKQLKVWNIKWAATAASGLGSVKGWIYDAVGRKLTGDTPTVTYNRRLFNEDGKVVLSLKTHPADRNCIQCHGDPDLQKRGFTWNDPVNPDVHNQRGLRCTDCHASKLDHNFAKGRTVVETVRDDLENTVASCEACHTKGLRGATIARHDALPPSHLQKISCKTCHIPALHRSARKFFDATRGDVQWDVLPELTKVGDKETWYPAYEKVDGKLVPVNPALGIWWGNKDEGGGVHPLFERELRAAWAAFGARVKDDNGDGIPEVNTAEEIGVALAAFQKVLAEGGRFAKVHPVLIKGDKLWELGPDGKATSRADEACRRQGFSISHNVAPVKMALGAGGCVDCHSREGKFFSRTYLVDPYDTDGKAIFEPVYHTIGLSDTSFGLFSVYWSAARPYIGLLLLFVFFVVALHFTRFGPHDFGGKPLSPRPDDYERMTRFSAFERLLHLAVLASCLFLAFTGLMFSFNGWRWLQLVFGENVTPRVWHGWLGFVFGGGVVLMMLKWWKDAILVRSDWAWIRELGGYLGSHKPVPAGRFNAGQKIYFWLVVLGGLTVTVTGVILFYPKQFSINVIFMAAFLHNLAGLSVVAGVLAHIYLSTAANPGTFQAIFAGWVTKGWARLHHPLWYEKVTKRPVLDGDADVGSAPSEEPKQK